MSANRMNRDEFYTAMAPNDDARAVPGKLRRAWRVVKAAGLRALVMARASVLAVRTWPQDCARPGGRSHLGG
jgi:hypothetical protein